MSIKADRPIINENLLFFLHKRLQNLWSNFAKKKKIFFVEKYFLLNLQVQKNPAYFRAKKKKYFFEIEISK